MRFVVNIACDNAAFEDVGGEVARILTENRHRIRVMTEAGDRVFLYDANGNKVGDVRLTV